MRTVALVLGHALVVIGCLTACGQRAAPAVSVSDPFPAGTADTVFHSVVAGDGSLWFGQKTGHQLTRLGTDRHLATISFAPSFGAVPQAASVYVDPLAPSSDGSVWFNATAQVPGSPATGVSVVGRVGSGGMIGGGQRLTGREFRPAAGATDGALWTGEHVWSQGGDQKPATWVPDLLRVDVNGAQRRFPVDGDVVAIVPGRAGSVWIVQRNGPVLHIGSVGVIAASSVPAFDHLPPEVASRADGSLGVVADAPDRDVCLAGTISGAGEVRFDGAHPLIDDHRGQPYGPFGCPQTYAGADGSLWLCEMPIKGPHGDDEMPNPPWYVFHARTDGRHERWTLPSRDYVAAMAPGPHNAMWFVSGKRHQLGVITADGHISEGLASLPASAAPAGTRPFVSFLIPTGGTTLYLATWADGFVRVLTVPPM